MKKRLLILIAIMNISYNNAQQLDDESFDFWVGDWNLTWQDTKGNTLTGTNNIVKILDDKVIQENFKDPITKYKGMSLSVFDPKAKIWHQAWTDNQGGYYDFVGDLVNGNPCFKTKLVEKGTKKIVQRMVFSDIKKDGFKWIWEGTEDGGKTWVLLWKIDYVRK